MTAGEWPQTAFEAVLPADLPRVSGVRRITAANARFWGVAEDAVHDAALIVDELFVNAVRHGSRAGDEVTLSLTLDWPELHIAVGDAGEGVPTRHTPEPESENGRGLFLVAALSAKWGVDPYGPGKRTWAVLDLSRLQGERES